MQQIVVGYVETETAERAARQAAMLAVQLGAHLHVVTALERPDVETFAAFGETFVVDDFERAERAVHNFMVGLDEQPSYTVTVVEGKPADAILAEAKRVGAELIVVGNVRMQGPGRVLGSVGSAVLHHAPCDVLVVKTV